MRVLEIDPQARRMSLSIRRASEAAPAPTAMPATTAAPAAAKKAKKRPPLKGGLDWNW